MSVKVMIIKNNNTQEPNTKLSQALKTKIEKMLKWKIVKNDKKWETHLRNLLKNGMPKSINVRGLPF